MLKYRNADQAERTSIRAYVKENSGLSAQELSDNVKEKFSVDWESTAIIQWGWKNGVRITSRGSAEPAPAVKSDPVVEQAKRFNDLAKTFFAEHVPLRPIPYKVQATVLEDMGFSTEQQAVALFSDYHYGSKIDRRTTNGLAEYNPDIARERLARWRDGLLRFTQLSQITMDVNTLNLFDLGDDLEGHGRMFKSQALQMAEPVWFQMLGFTDDMTAVLLDFLVRYETINVFKVPGNHGRAEDSAKQAFIDNFEMMAWAQIAERIRAQVGGEWVETENGVRSLVGGPIRIHLFTPSIATVKIFDWTVVARHGHGIKGLQSTYTGALNNKLRLNAVLGEIINYYFKAHLHEAQSSESEINGEVIQNGCFVGPSHLSIEMSQAAANLPSQEFMLFHPKYGKTHHYRIHLADAEEVRKVAWIR